MAPVTTELKVLVKAIGKGELKELEASLQKLAVTARTKVDTNFKSVALELKKVQKTSAQSISNLRGYRNAWRDIAEQVDVTSREFQVATRNAEKLDAQLKKIQARPRGRIGGVAGAARGVGAIAAGGVFGGVEGAVGGGIGLLAGGPAGAAVGAAIGAQLGGFRQAIGGTAEYAAELSKLRIALQGVTTSQAEYEKSLNFIQKATKDYAIPQDVLTRQFTKLQASVQGAGGNIRDTETAFNGIVAAVRATGGSLTDVDAALTATAQVFSKGKVSAEELRQQIGERLPGAFTIFAESIGLTPQELDKALEKGQVSLQDFQTFAESLFERYGETAQIIADGPASAGDRLKVELQQLQESVGNLVRPIGAIFQNVALVIVENLNKAIGKIRELAGYLGGLRNIAKLATQGAVAALLPPGLGFLAGQEVGRQLDRIQVGDVVGDIQQPRVGAGLPGITPDAGAGDPARTSAAQKIKEISQAEYELRKQILQAKIEGREIDVIGFETQLKILKIQESKMGAMAQEVAIMDELRQMDEKIFRLEEQRSQQSLESYFNAQKALEEENALYEQQKYKILEASIAVGGISEKEGERIEKQMRIKDIAAEYNVNLEAATKIYERQNKTIKQQEDIWKSIGEAIKSGVGSAIENLIFETKSLQESLSGILRSVASLLIQYGTKTLFSAFGFANGGIMSGQGPMPLRTYARGGIANSPQLAMFGEGSMPEAYVPLPDGRSIPVTMRGNGGVKVGAINITVENTGEQLTPAAQKQLAGQVQGIVLSTLANERRSGGML